MRLYPSLFAYLNESLPVPQDTLLQARDRPIIALDPEENLSAQPCLISIDDIYEIAFPYLKPTDIEHHHNLLEYVLKITINGQSYNLRVTDEVLDLDAIKEENELPEWQSILGERLDNTAALLIRLLVGMFTNLFGYQKTRQPTILISQLQDKLDQINVDEANLPIVISLERRYQLCRKLENIASKLRHQLRRQAELMPVGRIQEMDAYCLRDYIRRPGVTAAQKAGAKQQLMGIQRYQDFNTAENKFLVYFSQILHLNCYQYERSNAKQYQAEVDKFRLVIDLFKQQPVVEQIQDRQYQFTKPNYVLQQNPVYRSFYQAYLEYIQKKFEKERIWSFRNQLFADTIYICLTAALLRFQGIGIDSTLSIAGSSICEQGRYIQHGASINVRVFLQNKVYVFGLIKPTNKLFGDWLLTAEIHQLDLTELETKKLDFPIWVFWYRPNNEAIAQLNKYLQKLNFKSGFVFYLQVPPSNLSPTGTIQSFSSAKLLLCQLPDLITAQGFSSTVALMARLIKSVVEHSL
ncbi:DUF2357 domain-containing protein [Hassallia byssoidea VB512170]|uniref:DUF2357 domain-containing protein n=1 Tax=Hassallia byssoidea VB512170 TaxID=1304833 RepID=A0A846H422_9CYAN|nr:DUF2357 domain-containing protein [Hassalia byssoidea]NEU71863.1 DUF2357 domain-containing protein [Hassalia byssoidea VB512170]